MLGIIVLFLFVAGTLRNYNRCCGQTTEDSLTTYQVGGHVLFECPDREQQDRESLQGRRPQVIRWTKDVSGFLFKIEYACCLLFYIGIGII